MQKFSVVQVTKDLVYDYKNWWPQFYKKYCLSNESYGKHVPVRNKKSFAISSFHHLTISTPQEVVGRELELINCPVKDTYRLRNTKSEITLPTTKAYRM